MSFNSFSLASFVFSPSYVSRWLAGWLAGWLRVEGRKGGRMRETKLQRAFCCQNFEFNVGCCLLPASCRLPPAARLPAAFLPLPLLSCCSGPGALLRPREARILLYASCFSCRLLAWSLPLAAWGSPAFKIVCDSPELRDAGTRSCEHTCLLHVLVNSCA